MRRAKSFAALTALAVATGFGLAGPAAAQVTAYEGARIIVGDGRTIDNGTIVVDGAKIAQVGPAASVQVPAGATRVNLAGKTVIPDLIDTHTHLSQTIEGLTKDLTQRAYYGVSAAQSMGTAETDAELQMRARPPAPGQARLFTAYRGITRPEPGRTMGPIWVNTEAEARKAVQDSPPRRWTSSRCGWTTATANIRR